MLRAVATTEVPNRDKLTELTSSFYEKPDTDKKLTASKVARQMVAPKQHTGAGVTAKDIKRDVLSELHPDRVVNDANSTDDSRDVFRAITEARQNDDSTPNPGFVCRDCCG